MIIKTLVEEKDRIDFLPKHLGNKHLKFEMLVYSLMDSFTKDYSGGFWNFWTLDNDGIFMTLDSIQSFEVINPMNYFEDTMTAEALSIGVNIFALNALMDESCDQRIIDYFYALRDFAAEHKECNQIFGLID